MPTNVYKGIVIVATVLATLLVCCSTAATPTLTCPETIVATLVPLKHLCYANGGDPDFFCEQFLPNEKHSNMRKMWTFFSVLAPVGPTHDVNNTFCVGIETVYKTDVYSKNYRMLSQHNTFTKNFSVGVLVVDRRCWTLNGTNCSLQVRLRADVLALPLFAQTPDYEEFWDFSSPLLRADLGWLDGLSVLGEGMDTSPFALRGLSGSSLRTLVIRDAFFWHTQVPPAPLDDLPRLRYLEISGSNVNMLRPESFNGSTNIEYLQLSGNCLKEIPSCIRRLPKLMTLLIESNVEEFKLYPEILVGFDNLIKLSFSGTPIANWTSDFPVLPGLKTLLLSHCGLTHINASEFLFPDLEYFDLSNNHLSSLPQRAFTNLHKLRYIDFSNNRLLEWPHFMNTHFQLINLSNNTLSKLVNLGDNGVTTVQLDVSHNIITQWNDPKIFVMHSNNTRTLLTHRDNRDVNLTSPATNYSEENKLWVLILNISGNNIMNVTAAMLASMGDLEEVDLGGNIINCADCLMGPLQKWLNTTDTRVFTLGTTFPLECSLPAELSGVPVEDAPFDAAACLDPRVHLWLGLGLPLCILACITIAASGTVYYFRTEVAYLTHLAKVRSNSKRKPNAHHECLYDAFVCYSGKNRKFVLHQLSSLLEHPPESYRLCLFDRDFRLGSHIVDNIVEAIDNSTKVVVVLTEHFITSKWCQWELEMANHKLFGEDREFLVLLELEPLERRRLPRLLRFLLDTRPVVRWPRPETTPQVLAAAALLRRALGASLRQRQRQLANSNEDPNHTCGHQRINVAENEIRPGCSNISSSEKEWSTNSSSDERTPLLRSGERKLQQE